MEDDSTISFEIYTDADPQKTDGQPNSVVHCQGYVEIFWTEQKSELNLTQLQGQCLQTQLTAEQCYQAFASVGIQYGPGHQAIDIVYIGNQQVLAKLRLPSALASTAKQFVLHPSLMDSALQASIGLALGSEIDSEPKPSLPYALESLEIYDMDSPLHWVWIRESDSSNRGGFQKLDLDLGTSTGQICVKIRGFSARVLERELASTESSLSLLTNVWNVISAKELESQQDNFGKCRVIIAGGTQQQKALLGEVYPNALWLSETDFSAISRQIESLFSESDILHIIWVAPSEQIGRAHV